MRHKLLYFLKTHPRFLSFCWSVAKVLLRVAAVFVPVRKKTVLFSSFGGRGLHDSPRAIYEEMCRRPFFSDYEFIWALDDPKKFDLPRGRAVKIDTPAFFLALLYSRVWVGNSEIDRGIGLGGHRHVRVETWHGTPLKCIGGEEKQNSILAKKRMRGKKDSLTLRCAQSEYDKEIFMRIFDATEDSFLLCDLPRNDALTASDIAARGARTKEALGIPADRRVILYMPTYREYLVDEKRRHYITPPITESKWKEALSDRYAVLVRAHYAVSAAMQLDGDGLFYDVSNYPDLTDLYAAADVLLSDYSSAFVDYSILERPMLCFAYDLDVYLEKRGLYVDLEKTLPCPVCRDEDVLLSCIVEMDVKEYTARARDFRMRFAPYAGHAASTVTDEIEKRLCS